jgi:hypothetical protein
MSKNESMLDEIPNGCYCYTIIEIKGMILKTKLCPYYTYLDEGFCKCSLTGITSEDDFLLDDQIKICGENEEMLEIDERS